MVVILLDHIGFGAGKVCERFLYVQGPVFQHPDHAGIKRHRSPPHISDGLPANVGTKRSARLSSSGRTLLRSRKSVIIAQGGRFGGWSLYVKDGNIRYCYNWLNRERYTLESKDALPGGQSRG